MTRRRRVVPLLLALAAAVALLGVSMPQSVFGKLLLLPSATASLARFCPDPAVPQDVADAHTRFIAAHQHVQYNDEWIDITIPEPDGSTFDGLVIARYFLRGDADRPACSFIAVQVVGPSVQWNMFPVRYEVDGRLNSPTLFAPGCWSRDVPDEVLAEDGVTTLLVIHCPVLVLE